MALIANGSKLSWDAYHFGVRRNGDTIKCDSLEDAQAMADAQGGEVVMRAIYSTGWMEML